MWFLNEIMSKGDLALYNFWFLRWDRRKILIAQSLLEFRLPTPLRKANDKEGQVSRPPWCFWRCHTTQESVKDCLQTPRTTHSCSLALRSLHSIQKSAMMGPSFPCGSKRFTCIGSPLSLIPGPWRKRAKTTPWSLHRRLLSRILQYCRLKRRYPVIRIQKLTIRMDSLNIYIFPDKSS